MPTKGVPTKGIVIGCQRRACERARNANEGRSIIANEGRANGARSANKGHSYCCQRRACEGAHNSKANKGLATKRLVPPTKGVETNS